MHTVTVPYFELAVAGVEFEALPCGNYLSEFDAAAVPANATCPLDHFSPPTNFPSLSPLSPMNFEDVEERDGVQFVHSRTGGFISSLFQAFDCRGTFGLRLALRPIAP